MSDDKDDEGLETLSVRFPRKIRTRLIDLAEAGDRTPSQLVRRIVRKALADSQDDDGVAA